MEEKKNMTVLVVAQTWIYSFGGVNYDNLKNQNQLVERLNTIKLKDEFMKHNAKNCPWQSLLVKSQHYRVNNHGII